MGYPQQCKASDRDVHPSGLRLRWRNPPTPLVRGALEVLSLSPCGLHKFPPDKGGKGGSIPDNKPLAEKARQNRKNPTPAEPMGWIEVPQNKPPRSRTISTGRITTWRVDRPDIRTQTALISPDGLSLYNSRFMSPRPPDNARSAVFGRNKWLTWIPHRRPSEFAGIRHKRRRVRAACP